MENCWRRFFLFLQKKKSNNDNLRRRSSSYAVAQEESRATYVSAGRQVGHPQHQFHHHLTLPLGLGWPATKTEIARRIRSETGQLGLAFGGAPCTAMSSLALCFVRCEAQVVKRTSSSWSTQSQQFGKLRDSIEVEYTYVTYRYCSGAMSENVRCRTARVFFW
jgi:hypothetical protein